MKEKIILFVLTPLVLIFGAVGLKNQNFYAVSILLLVFGLVCYGLSFEKKQIATRDIVLIVVMTGIAVASRSMFYMFPQVKPMSAIIILTGIYFGREKAVMVGGLSGFVSNFFFGQGAFTPFQMYGFMCIGFISGSLGKNKWLKKHWYAWCMIAFVMTVVVYGGIVNLSTVFAANEAITVPYVLLIYGSGLPFDLIHGVSTAIFLALLNKPMGSKMNRLKIKYGL